VAFDLHTLRLAGGEAAAQWAMEQENWVILGIDHEEDHLSLRLVRELQKLGKSVHLVCPRCARDGIKLLRLPVYEFIEDIDEQVDVISLHGDVDQWTLAPHISQRMQWYGDIKVIWPPENLVDDRWVSEMYDYGIAVAYNCRLPI
tara:strand:+ start:573 stop:1007 length:435 start_codon:yes stop_codon:yes gene_type:complete